jgi:hypothetical protein
MAGIAGVRRDDVRCFGHTHKAWHRVVEGVHFVNTGSVGRPKDGGWRAGYVVLEVGDGEPQVEFVRLEYNLERTMEGIRLSALPNDFAEYRRTGGVLDPAPTAADVG